jgi:DNA-binding beta-propeller fold protein YncE
MKGKLSQRQGKQKGSKRKIISKKFDINSTFLCALCASVVLLSNCKDEPTRTQTNSIPQGRGLFVANEGTFGMGNASLTYINLENDTLNTEEDLFKTNNNRPLGDVFQSMSLINKNAWLVVNNSGKIEVINPETSKSVATIKNLKSPRHALEVILGKVYVSDLYANAISIVDANSFTKTGEIKCKGWTEEMIVFQNKVWISNHNSDYLYIINPTTDIITDSIPLAYGGSSLLSDKEGKVWVLCSGDLIKKRTGGLFCINATTLKIEKQWLFTKDDFNPVKLKQNPATIVCILLIKEFLDFPKQQVFFPQIH